MKDAKRIVIKIGTSSLTYETGRLNLGILKRLVFTLSDIKNSGREVILVSSGAVGVGSGKLNVPIPTAVEERQAIAAVGQSELIAIYDKLFSHYSHTVAQVLINKKAAVDKEQRYNIKSTFESLLKMGVIPIVNENDTVSTDELRMGDNDTLSAVVANIVDADSLIILTDMDGLYDKNPRDYDDAKLISKVDKITDDILDLASGKGSSFGSGGMKTKLLAGKMVTEQGIDMAIINGNNPENIEKVLNGEDVGTYFKATEK